VSAKSGVGDTFSANSFGLVFAATTSIAQHNNGPQSRSQFADSLYSSAAAAAAAALVNFAAVIAKFRRLGICIRA
jgi:hypothetical protein